MIPIENYMNNKIESKSSYQFNIQRLYIFCFLKPIQLPVKTIIKVFNKFPYNIFL